MPPELIAGRYRVEREIGRGGMGSVWLCRDERLGREVAAKQVGRLPGESATDLARALREARSSAPLNHPSVVSVYDAIEEGDHAWLVMEYVPGHTLSELMARDGSLPPERVAAIGAQIADGLAAAHARGTVHRDVKPGNVLVTADDHAKISDFGIARTPGDPTLTQTGLVIGTPAYFSPQLARGDEPKPSDDVWALGATLYAAVEGQPPYPDTGNAIAMLTHIAANQPPKPERAGFLTDAIGRMLDPDPASRWSMADAAHALQRLDRRHRAGGTKESTAPQAAPATERVPVAEPAPAPPPAAAPERRRRRGALLLAVLLLVLLLGGGWLLLAPGDDGGNDTASGPTGGGSHSARPDPTNDASQQPTPDQTQGSTQEPAPQGSDPEQFVDDYYAALPDDTRAGWQRLSPEYRSRMGYDDYRGFWSTIDSVTVDDTAPAGADAVDVTLTYVTDDGSTDTEVRRVHLERAEDGYLITHDEIVG